MPTGAPGEEGGEGASLPVQQLEGGKEGVPVAGAEVAATTAVLGCSVSGAIAGTSNQQVTLAELPTADQLKAMGLCDTLIILSDASQLAQPVSLVSQLEPVQCLDGTAEAVARSGANLVLCLPDETLSLDMVDPNQDVPAWSWLPAIPASAATAATGEEATLVRPSAAVGVSAAASTLATAPGEMLLVMDSSPVEDSVGLAAKSWFNDSVIATQALLTLEGHK